MLNVAVDLGAAQAHGAEAVVVEAEVDGLAADHHVEVVPHIPMADILNHMLEPVEAEIQKVWSGARQITTTGLLWSQSLVELAPIIKGMEENARMVVLFMECAGLQMNAQLLLGGMSLISSP